MKQAKRDSYHAELEKKETGSKIASIPGSPYSARNDFMRDFEPPSEKRRESLVHFHT